jgi:hypothetical protein
MSEDVQYSSNWPDEATQCKNCKQFQEKDGKSACVSEEKTFDEAVAEYGEIEPAGHCKYFEAA